MPRLRIRPLASPQDVEDALEIWSRARHALHRTPGEQRRTRVTAILADAPVALLAEYGDRPAGMAVAEPYREGDVVDDARGHISMLFVTPARWGNGIGSALVHALQAPPSGTDWTGLSTWTRASNVRAQRLYRSCGFADTGERATLQEGETILRFSWPADPALGRPAGPRPPTRPGA